MRLLSTLLVLLYTIRTPTSAAEERPVPNNASLLWGPYRPNLYLGIRSTVPNSLITGLMWGKLEDVQKCS